MDSKEWITLVIGILGGGGLMTAVRTFFTVKPEAGQMLVTTAQGVVLIQTGVIENLEKELKRVADESKQNKENFEKCASREKLLHDRVWELEKQAGMHETKN